MTVIVFVLPDGTRRTIEAQDGMSLMRVALNAGLRGVMAECGGFCQCATCHVYVDESARELVGLPNSNEKDMLEGVAAPLLEGRSRLSCQIVVTSRLDGMVVQIPEFQ